MTLLFCSMHLSDEDGRLSVDAARAAQGQSLRRVRLRWREGRVVGQRPRPLGIAPCPRCGGKPLMADGLKGNPRQVKRFLNALMLRKELASVAGLEQAIETNKLVKLMILEYVEPELFVDLFNKIDSDGRVSLLDALEAKSKNGPAKKKERTKMLPGWSKAWTARWAAMDPSLSGTDLRDYFWLSRDRLASTFAGITMVPPIVRAVVGDFATGLEPKLHPAVATARQLGADELAAMYTLLEQNIAARLSDTKSYKPLRALAKVTRRGGRGGHVGARPHHVSGLRNARCRGYVDR